VLAVVLATACATSTRPPATAATADPTSAALESPDAPDDDDLEDEDGEVEATSEPAAQAEAAPPCPTNMVLVVDALGPKGEPLRFCIDKYEASLVEVDADGNEKPYPHYLPVDGHTVRAVSVPGVFPQGFISEVQAEEACAASGKRLCTHAEWKTACMGPSKTTFPYGDTRQAGLCHDRGRSAVAAVFGFHRLADPVAMSPRKASSTKASSERAAKTARPAHVVKGKAAETTRKRPTRTAAKGETPSKKKPRSSRSTDKSVAGKSSSAKNASTSARASLSKRAPASASTRPASVEPSVWSQLNDPRLGQVEGAVARTGSHEACVSGYGAVDMVGNLHEWVKTDPSSPHGTFAGGYYLDTTINGEGCGYRTTAHAHDYHDYSTGFRCCADAAD
jgi:hypothetical protein